MFALEETKVWATVWITFLFARLPPALSATVTDHRKNVDWQMTVDASLFIEFTHTFFSTDTLSQLPTAQHCIKTCVNYNLSPLTK